MITFTTIATSWIIEIPTGDPEMPWGSMGSWFKTEEDAKKALSGWRQELRDVARIRQHSYKSCTAHQA